MQCALVFFVSAIAAGVGGSNSDLLFLYNDQDQWPKSCNSKETSRQSPINIISEDVIENEKLKPLLFAESWQQPVSGTLVKNGESVQFTPLASDRAVVATPSGLHELVEVCLHWGRNRGEGSEHRINGEQYDMEIQFVNTKLGSSWTHNVDYHVIIAVFAIATEDDEQLRGVWEKLNVSYITPYETSMINITDISYSELLPESQHIKGTYNYYHYEGSLTTPPCNETVHWYILKDPIMVPGRFLKLLREIENNVLGEKIKYNMRDVQDYNHNVTTPTNSGDILSITIFNTLLYSLYSCFAYMIIG